MKTNFKPILCGLIAAVIASSVILPMAGCESKSTDSTQSQTSSEESAATIDTASQSNKTASENADSNAEQGSLQAVLNALVKDGSGYSEYKSYSTTTEFTEKIDGEKSVITAKGDGEYDPNGTWEFVQDGDFITYHNNAEDFTGVMFFMNVTNAVADSLGMDSKLLTGYINGVSVLNIESDYYKQTENDDGTTDFKLYMAAPFEMKELDEMYVTEELLADSEPLTDEFTSRANSVGKISILSNGNKSSLKILIKEYEKLDDLAVKSVINTVNAYQPDGYEKFVESFTAFEDITTDDYTVTANADDAAVLDMVEEKDDGYAYAIVTFGKEEAEK